MRRLSLHSVGGLLLVLSFLLMMGVWRTIMDLRPVPPTLTPTELPSFHPQVLDRHGVPLSVTFRNPWNLHDWVPLHCVPPSLLRTFIFSEDKRFYSHRGVDWGARFNAFLQNAVSRRVVRGASTITEQVVRMLNPRPRTIWSRWVEGFEAYRLESRFSKAEILEFYLNQIPYARQRRGVAQAAQLYFDRDLSLLNEREIVALVVLVRSPSRLDLFRNRADLDRSVDRLIRQLRNQAVMPDRELELASRSPLSLQPGRLPCDATHFVRHVLGVQGATDRARPHLPTTLDAGLQTKCQNLLDSSLQTLHDRDTINGALLVVDHRNGEILAWVNGNGGIPGESKPASWIDAVILPRQPGSTLKPFLYALALEKGWTAATLLDDAPLSEPLRFGLHTFRNYSRTHYGSLRLREALGNSLNVPAVRAVQFTGTQAFLTRLRQLGFENLTRSSHFYGHGLALGDGEVSLFELVQAYSCLARRGQFIPLQWSLPSPPQTAHPRALFSEDIASIIAHILSDPQARRIEFGEGHLLSHPVETAVKTGTSTDHRDTWAIGFSRHHVVGVWMGNLDRRPTRGLTGTTGPGFLLRAVFSELNRNDAPGWLCMSDRIERKTICQRSGLLAGAHCPKMDELFVPGSAPVQTCALQHEAKEVTDGSGETTSPSPPPGTIQLVQPIPGLQMAMDPRVPDDLESFSLRLPKHLPLRKVHWMVDGKRAGTTGRGQHRFDWPMTQGNHTVFARVWVSEHGESIETPPVTFSVQ